jgi:hypothetical protein
MAESLHVQVTFARPDRQFLLDLALAPGSTVQDAIFQSGILKLAPEIDLDHCRVGIYSRLKTLDTVLREHDRVEIYRPLIADPKDARRKRAAGKA